MPDLRAQAPSAPAWWTERGVLAGLPTDNNAVVTRQQLYQFALAALLELDGKLAGMGGATGSLSAAAALLGTPQPLPGLHAEYFNNPDFSGSPVLLRQETTIGFDGGEGGSPASPAPGVDARGFSARWAGELIPATGGLRVFEVQYNNGDADRGWFRIEWELNIASTGWQTVWHTDHPLFVTLGTPLGWSNASNSFTTSAAMSQLTLYWYGCWAADGATTEADARDWIYETFQLAVSLPDPIIRRDGTVLTYWMKDAAGNTIDYPPHTTADFLAAPNGNGNCQAWSGLFRDMYWCRELRLVASKFSKQSISLCLKISMALRLNIGISMAVENRVYLPILGMLVQV
jgi:hypothetical protein